jgi:hypothetical protein
MRRRTHVSTLLWNERIKEMSSHTRRRIHVKSYEEEDTCIYPPLE